MLILLKSKRYIFIQSSCCSLWHTFFLYWDFTLPIKRASCPLHFLVVSLGTPVEERNPSLIVRDYKRIKMRGKTLGVSWWMEFLKKSLGPKNTRGLRPLGFWPWDFPRDSIHHYTHSTLSHIVPLGLNFLLNTSTSHTTSPLLSYHLKFLLITHTSY